MASHTDSVALLSRALNSFLNAKFLVTADFEFLLTVGEAWLLQTSRDDLGMLFALSHLSVGALLPSVQRTPTPAQGAASQGFVQQVQSSIAIAALAGVLSSAVVPPAFAKASIHGTSTILPVALTAHSFVLPTTLLTPYGCSRCCRLRSVPTLRRSLFR